MKRFSLVVLISFFFLTFSATSAVAAPATSSFRFDFEDTPATTTLGWNTITNHLASAAVTNLKDTTGAVTDLSLKVAASFSGVNATGTTSTASGYPASATADSFYVNAGRTARLTVSNLAQTAYTFKFFASRMNAGGARATTYTIGSKSATLDANNNNAATVSIASVTPVNGVVNIDILNSASLAYLNILEIIPENLPQPENSAPMVSAGADKAITLPTTTTTLTGSATDADGTINSYAWTFMAGPATPVLATPGAATTTVSGLSEIGTYTFRLTATDDDGAIGVDSVIITVSEAVNAAPIANAGADQSLTLPVTTTTLTGSATDADGTIASYAWSFLSGPAAPVIQSPEAAFSGVMGLSVSGTYTFRLTVADNAGATDTDDVRVTVNNQSASCPAKKIAVIGSSTAYGTGANPISNAWVNRYDAYLDTFNLSNSVSKFAVSGYTTYHALPTGTTPPAGRPAPDTTRNITAALAINPHAIIVNLPSNDEASGYTMAEQQANFRTIVATAQAAGVPVWVATTQPRDLAVTGRQNQILMRDWLTATYGAYAIDFWNTIANADGTIAAAYSNNDGIHVNNAGHEVLFNRVVAKNIYETLCSGNLPTYPPTVNAGIDQTIIPPVASVTLSGSATDSDGTIASYAWAFLSGPATPVIQSGAASSPSLVVTGLTKPGIYTFRLTATDNRGATGFDDVVVTVAGEAAPLPVDTARTIFLDFAGAYTTSGAGWNTVTGHLGGSVLTGLRDAQGTTTGAQIKVDASFSGTSSGTTSTSAPYPVSATRDSFYVNAGRTAQFTISNLPDASYTLRFFGSRPAAGGARVTTYTVGSKSATLDANDNVVNTVALSGIVPTARSIVVTVKNAASLGYINVLEVIPEVSG